MGNFCIKILSVPSVCPSVVLSKSNWGRIPTIMTPVVPGDGQCILSRCVQLTSTHWQSHLSPHAYERILLSPGWFPFHKKLAPLPQPCFPLAKMCKMTHFSHHFCVNNEPSLTHLSVACERVFLWLRGLSILPFWSMLHLGICKALSTDTDTDLPMNAAGTTVARLYLLSVLIYCIWLQSGCFPASKGGLQVLYTHLLWTFGSLWNSNADGLWSSHVHRQTTRKYGIYHTIIHILKHVKCKNESYEVELLVCVCVKCIANETNIPSLCVFLALIRKKRLYLKQSVAVTTEMWACADKHKKGVKLCLHLFNCKFLSKEEFKCFQSRSGFLA